MPSTRPVSADVARSVVHVCVFGNPVSPVETDEPIEMPLRVTQTRVCPENHVLDGGAH